MKKRPGEGDLSWPSPSGHLPVVIALIRYFPQRLLFKIKTELPCNKNNKKLTFGLHHSLQRLRETFPHGLDEHLVSRGGAVLTGCDGWGGVNLGFQLRFPCSLPSPANLICLL